MIIKHFLLALSLLFFIASCTKISETEIGTGLIPPIDGVITKDTDITVYTKNFTDVDTARVSLYEDHALGYVNDPVFGTTEAAINLQLLPATYPTTFEVSDIADSLKLDSVVLALKVNGVWGDTTQMLSLHVKELESDLPFESDSSLIKYNNTSVFSTADDITYNGSYSYDPSTWNDAFNFKTYLDSGTNELRIRLSSDFGNRFVQMLASNPYSSDSAFKIAFKGFQISAEPIGNCLLRIGLANTSSGAEPNTKLALYYRYTSRTASNGEDTAAKYFTVNTASSNYLAPYAGSAHSNYIKRNLSAGQAGAYFPATASVNDDYLYLQTTPGTFGTITIDSTALRNLPNWIIHRAEIVMEQAPFEGSSKLDNFTTPYLFLVVKNNNGTAFQNDTTKYIIPGFDSTNISTRDALFSASSPSYLLSNYADFGGVPFRKTNIEGVSNINYYNFNLSRYIQGIVTKKNPQYTFTLYTPFKEYIALAKGLNTYTRVTSTPLNNAGIGRVRLYGGGDNVTNPHRMKLHIVYSIPH